MRPTMRTGRRREIHSTRLPLPNTNALEGRTVGIVERMRTQRRHSSLRKPRGQNVDLEISRLFGDSLEVYNMQNLIAGD